MEFCRKRRVIVFFDVMRAKAEFGESLIRGAVKQDRIVSHIKVVIVVDPIPFDIEEIGHEEIGMRHGVCLAFNLAALVCLTERKVKQAVQLGKHYLQRPNLAETGLPLTFPTSLWLNP